MESSESDGDQVAHEEVRSLRLLSLEYVACNAGRYSNHRLATLPRNLRIHLMRLMSIVDICGVEHSPVCADVDLSLYVWRVVAERIIHLGQPLNTPIPLRDMEDMFHAVGGTSVTWRDKEWILEHQQTLAEFSKERFLNTLTWCLFSNRMLRNAAIATLFFPPLPHYGKPSLNNTSEEQLLESIFHECHFFPSAIYIDCTEMLHSGIWERRQTSFSSIRKVLCRVKQLTISLSGPSRVSSVMTQHRLDISHLFRFIIEAVFVRDDIGRLEITHIFLKGDVAGVTNAVEHLVYFLTQRCDGVSNFTSSSLHCQYSGLRSLSIELNSDGLGNDVALINSLHSNLRQIIAHQKALHKLCMLGWSTSLPLSAQSEYEQLLKCVAELYDKPSFKSLTLQMHLYHNCYGHEVNLRRILNAFMSSPIREQVFKGYNISGSGPNVFWRQVFGITTPVFHNQVTHKRLYQIEDSVNLWFNTFLTQCLIEHSSYQNLTELILDGVEDISDDTLIGIKQLRLHVLRIKSPPLDLMTGISIHALEQIFTIPSLKSLSLDDVVYGDLVSNVNLNSVNRFIQAVARGLRKQGIVHKLVELDLGKNCLGSGRGEYVREMFQALFSLPQISSVVAFFHNNSLKRDHFELMCMAWQLCAENKKMLQLGVSDVRRETQIYMTCKNLKDIAYVIT